MGVLLPDTPAEGARKFAEDVCKAIATYTSPPVFRVFTYPSQWLHGNNGDPTHLSDTDIPKDSKASQVNESTNLMDGFGHLLGYHMPGWKRFIDVVGALFGLILVFPVFLLIAILIKIVSSGPVFFKQERLGYLGRPFTCWKFRTMRLNADPGTHQQHLCNLIHGEVAMTKLDEDDDTRIIPLGKFLRQTGLDELPQLFHVLFGEMSLIGPRPCIPYEAQEYLLWHRKRFDIMPGLTGLWQVSGKNRTTFKEMMRLDIKYLEHRSFWFDLKILLRTLPAIITQG
jgi:lipopolysaccharide/colanic/teichoic acid biosynthesis glycosyltransferase